MSQLDYLWLNFGGYQIGTEPSSIPQQNVVLNELAVTSLIKNATNGGILSLEYREDQSNPDQMILVGKSVDGQDISFVSMPKEVHVQSFVGREVNSMDIANGCQYPLKTKVLSIVLTNGKEYLVSLNSLGLVLQGGETKSVVSEIIDGKVYNHVKLAKANLSVVELKETVYGLSADLYVSPEKTGVELTKADSGLQAKIPLGNSGNYVKFDRMSLNAYMALTNKDDYTVYFITDKPYLFVGSQKYGVDINTDIVTELMYDKVAMELSYKTSDGVVKTLSLGPATESSNGMMTSTQVLELQKLKTALDGIVSVKDYINTAINGLGTSLSYGDIIENKRPLHLKNTTGDIISTVWLDVETYLKQSLQRNAKAKDVIDAAQSGISLNEGDQIILLILINGDKHFIKLQDLFVTLSFKDTNTIKFTQQGNIVTADVNINDNKILYITENGISANIQVVRDKNFIKLYGYDTTEKHLLGKFLSPTKELQSTLFVPSVTQEIVDLYPPSYVDWKENQSIILGMDYYLLFYKDMDNNDQIYYLSIPKPDVRIADIEGNLLKQTENGDLYVLFEWINS